MAQVTTNDGISTDQYFQLTVLQYQNLTNFPTR